MSEHTIHLENVRDYNILLDLVNEEGATVTRIRKEEDKSRYIVNIQGEENHLKFIKYLLDKKKKSVNQMLKKVGAE